MQKQKQELISCKEYQNLVNDCKAIMVERVFNSRIEIINCKWELGQRIVEEEKNFDRFGYGKRIIEKLAEDLEMSSSHLWKCIQFYKKYPEENFEKVINLLPEGKNISWFKISQKLLSDANVKNEEKCRHLETENVIRCKNCKKIL